MRLSHIFADLLIDHVFDEWLLSQLTSREWLIEHVFTFNKKTHICSVRITPSSIQEARLLPCLACQCEFVAYWSNRFAEEYIMYIENNY